MIQKAEQEKIQTVVVIPAELNDNAAQAQAVTSDLRRRGYPIVEITNTITEAQLREMVKRARSVKPKK